MNTITILTEEKLSKDILIYAISNMLHVKIKDIMYIEDTNEWLNKTNEIVVIEYLGITDDDIAMGMHMYDIFSDMKIETKELQNYINEKIYDSEEF